MARELAWLAVVTAIALVGVLVAASVRHAALGEWPPASFAVYVVALIAIARVR
jgi:hypothetical protein